MEYPKEEKKYLHKIYIKLIQDEHVVSIFCIVWWSTPKTRAVDSSTDLAKSSPPPAPRPAGLPQAQINFKDRVPDYWPRKCPPIFGQREELERENSQMTGKRVKGANFVH